MKANISVDLMARLKKLKTHSLPLQKQSLLLGSAEEENPLPHCEHTSISCSGLYVMHAYFALCQTFG